MSPGLTAETGESPGGAEESSAWKEETLCRPSGTLFLGGLNPGLKPWAIFSRTLLGWLIYGPFSLTLSLSPLGERGG